MKHPNFLTASQCAEDVLANIPDHWNGSLINYAESLRSAFANFSPVFTQEHYADFYLACASQDPAWIPSNVLANARKESDGSRLLYELWRRVRDNLLLEDDIMLHIRDEIRHSKLFISLAELAYPDIAGQPFVTQLRKELFALDSAEISKDTAILTEAHIVDHLVQMNLGEIRTRVHISLIAPLISAFTPEMNRPKVQKLLASLVDDETSHIAYTAKHLEAMLPGIGSEAMNQLFTRRLRDLHQYTLDETTEAVAEHAPNMANSFQ